MAVLTNLQEAIDNFEAASNGGEVRQALIDLLETLATLGGDVLNLNGKPSSYYITEATLSKIEYEVNLMLHYDTEPIDGSFKVIKNKDLTQYLRENVLNRLKAINGDASGNYDDAPEEEIGRNIKACLTILKQNMDNMWTAIDNKLGGQEPAKHMHDTDTVMNYSERIDEIKYSHIDLKPFVADHNGEYTIPQNTAYNPITVKLRMNGQDIVADHDGDYEPDSGYDGIKSINVKVPSSGGSGSGGYGGSSGKGTGELGEDDSMDNVGPRDIFENGEYEASSYGLEGFSQVNISVSDFEIPDDTKFTVIFQHPNGKELQKVPEVLPGSYVPYTGDTPVYKDENDEFWVFAGWDPMPINVLCDMVCVAQFTNYTPNNGNPLDVSYSYIQSAWEDILLGKGTFEIGDVKLLKLESLDQVIRMRCVSKESSAGTWIALDQINVGSNHVDDNDWGSSALKTYLNGEFLNNEIPSWLKKAISPARKWSLERYSEKANHVDWGKGAASDKAFSDKNMSTPTVPGMRMAPTDGNYIWVPGVYEMNLLNPTDTGELSSNIYRGLEQYGIINKDGKTCNKYNYPTNTYCGLVAFQNGAIAKYGGELYTDAFKYFTTSNGSNSYRDFFRNLANNEGKFRNENYGNIVNSFLPHVKGQKIEGAGSQNPEGKYWSEIWDDLDYSDQKQHMNYEPNLDLYSILLKDKGKYFPSLSTEYANGTNSYQMSGYYSASISNGKDNLLRDVWLNHCDLSYDSQHDSWTVDNVDYGRAKTGPFGYIGTGGAGSGGQAATTCIIGFTLSKQRESS